MGGPLQLLLDCPECRVECAVVEMIDPVRQVSFGRCRLCAAETVAGTVVTSGRRFTSAAEVDVALLAWAAEEGEPPEDFVVANFGGRTRGEIGAAVLAGEFIGTSFDVIAWLFKDRTGGSMVLGGAALPAQGPGETTPDSWGRGAGGPPATPPRALVGRGAAPGGAAEAPRGPPPPDPLAVTRALVATALADGLVLEPERRVLDQLCDKLGAPRATEADWRAWRPHELGRPPEPEKTIAAMRVLALADRIPDAAEARVITEFARAWRVPLPDPVLPPVTLPQKLTANWLALFGR